MYKYKAKVLEVYDADTLTLLIDIGFNIHIEEKCRLYGIDTPELRTKNKKEKALGYEARDFVMDLILGKEVEIQTHKGQKKGKFGRYLVDIVVPREDSKYVTLNNVLIDEGYAKPYFGEKKEEWVF